MGWKDDIGPKTQEFLEIFGEKFLKSYGISLFLKIKADVEADKEEADGDSRKLKYRDWDSIPRQEFLEGACYIKEGEGPGSFGGWSSVYIVEQPDYNIAVYKDAKTAASRDPKKAKFLLRMAGYSLEKNVTEFYRAEARSIAADLDCDEPEVGFSSFSWALTHPLRPNYVLQLHKGAAGGRACLGGASVEPADAGAENAEKMEEWASAMDEFIANSSPRDLEGNVVAMAFERTVQKMALSIEALDGFSDDGSESQILSHMAFVAVFEAACKSEVQEELKQVPIGRVTAWYKARGAAGGIVDKAVDPAWTALQKQLEGLSAKIEPKIRQGLEPILAKKMELQDKLKNQVGGKIGEAMSTKVTPLLTPLINAFDKPMRKGVESVIKIYEKEIDKQFPDESLTGELPAATSSLLDQLARSSATVEPLHEAAAELVQPLEAVKETAGEVLASFDPNEVRKQCQQALLELLDAAVYTTQEQMKPAEGQEQQQQLGEVKKLVVEGCKEDGKAVIAGCVRSTVVGALLAALAFATKDFVTPLLDSLKELIPEDLQEILDVEAEYNMLLESTIGEAVGKITDAKYK